jgi:hypothetical protein
VNTSTVPEREADLLVVSMVSACIQLTFAVNSSRPCDACSLGNKECTGRTNTAACDSCKTGKKRCTFKGVPIRRSLKQVVKEGSNDATIATTVDEGSNASVAASVGEGPAMADLVKVNLELAKQIDGLQNLIVSVLNAAKTNQEWMPVVDAYVTARQQADRGNAQQNDDDDDVSLD